MRFNNLLKYLSFGCVCLIIPVMAVATVLEKLYGTQFARDHIYVSVPVIVLWSFLTFFSLWYILKVRLYKKIATFCLHISLVVILTGALITHLSGKQGKIHLRVGEVPLSEFVTSGGETLQFPFDIDLKEFRFEYYPGTFSPSDFISVLEISDGKDISEATVSMNNIYSRNNYRFYQSGYDADGKGSFLSVSFDPYGIAVTYTGYVWLLLSILLFFFQKNTGFHYLLQNPVLKRGLAVLFFIVSCFMLEAAPSTLPREVADKFGDLYILYNGRVAPFNTFARDFATKIYGKPRYEGLTPEQIVTGWFFYYDDWKNEPVIKVKGERVKDILGIESNYAKLTDFVGPEGYKLDETLRQHDEDYNNASAANEKFNLISSLVTGSQWKIYPYKDNSGNLVWFSVTDKPEEEMPFEQWLFIRSALDLVAEKVALRDWSGANMLLDKIRKYQVKEGGSVLPTEKAIKTEKFYNSFNITGPLAMASLTFGILLFFLFILRIAVGKDVPIPIVWSGIILMALLFIYLSSLLGLRWYVSGHLPLSNGFETMQFMAWCAALLTLSVTPSFRLMLPFGFLLCGFTLLVAMMGESSPQITNLMPVLQSPLLSVHVMVIMLAYTLLAFMMFNGVAALFFSIGKNPEEKIEYLQVLSRLLLYPAVFLLAIGIFIGAVWANVSWGRYWGWDPKEVWALITLLIYAMPLHGVSLPLFRRPLFFHTYCIFAFLSVVITYFGVNFFLGGMHSYA